MECFLSLVSSHRDNQKCSLINAAAWEDHQNNVTNTGTLQIGDTVNLTTGTTGIQFADANGATLTFNGSSTINGDMGSLSGTDTFEVINGGAAGEIVTFNNNVYFIDSLNLSF